MSLFRPDGAVEEFRQSGAITLLIGILFGVVWFFFPEKVADSLMIQVACIGCCVFGLFGLFA